MMTSILNFPGATLRGVLVTSLGLVMLAWQTATIANLTLLFGVFLLVSGVAAATLAVLKRGQARWWLTLIEGAIAASVGIFILIQLERSSAFWVSLIAAWGILGAITQLTQPKVRDTFVLVLLYGISVGIGLTLIAINNGAFLQPWIVGAYALIAGGLQIFSSLRQREAEPYVQPVAA